MVKSDEWIGQRLSQAKEKAAEARRSVPDQVIEIFQTLLATRFQQPLKNEELKQAVVELATANSKPDAPREG